MAPRVRILKGIDVLREAFGFDIEKMVLLERWSSLNLQINKIARKSINDFIDAKAGVFGNSSHGKYEKFLKYLTNFNSGKSTDDKWSETYDINNNKITIIFVLTKNDDNYNGKTKPDPQDPVITIFLHLSEFEDMITSKDREEALKRTREYILSKQPTIAHEITHYFQLKTGILQPDNFFDIGEQRPNILNPFYFFCYFVEEHELEATINAAYKKYKNNRYNNKSYFNCFVCCVLDAMNEHEKANLFFEKGISFINLLKGLCVHDLFIMLWIIYYYFSKRNKFSELFYSGMSKEYKNIVDPELLNNNKKNIETFFKGLNQQQKLNFAKLLKTDEGKEYDKLLFSFMNNNTQIINNILEKIS